MDNTDKLVLHKTAVERTLEKLGKAWKHNNHRTQRAKSFLKRAKKSDKKRKIEKNSRKRNRK